MEHLELSPFKSKYLESNFVTRLNALRAASSNWNCFTKVEWSTNLWQEHEKFDDTPFIVRDYPDIWMDGLCPTEGQFIKCSYQVDAHSDGLVSTSFVQIPAKHGTDLHDRFNPPSRFRAESYSRMSLLHG